MTRHLQAVERAVGVVFAFDRANDHAVPAIVGRNARVESFKRQLRAHGFGLLGAFKRTALHHPAALVFLLGGLRGFRLSRYRRGLRGLALGGFTLRGMRRRLEQILIRRVGCLLLARRLSRLRGGTRGLLRLHGAGLRLLISRFCARGFRARRFHTRRGAYRLLRGVIPLLHLLLLLKLLLALQRLLTLRRGLFVPRHFAKLRRLTAHICLHLVEQLTLFVGQLILIHDFATGGWLGRLQHAWLAAFQLFDIAPALFRLGRQAVAGDFMARQSFRLFFFMMRNKVQTANKGDQRRRCDSDHRR
ncbi:hypothetical protein BN129_3530 [Cronobacter sakazakii 701]|nr:hypothetical protein BN129_3530 [Cronobacter sakazakii 701]